MIFNYNCPQCGADLVYDPEVGKMLCHHCGYTEAVAEKEEVLKPQEAPKDEHYHCPSCGAQLAIEQRSTSTICEYCGAPLILGDRLQGIKRPLKLIPFKIGKKEVRAAFKKWCHNGRIAPAGFTSERNLSRLQALYVPYWLFDADVTADLQATATRIRTFTDGRYMVTETWFYNVFRELELGYEHIDYDAAKSLDDNEMAKIAPYNYAELKDFATPYLAGFQSNQYDFTSSDLWPYIQKKIKGYSEDFARQTISGYSSVALRNFNIRFNRTSSTYTLMPLWFMEYRYGGKDYFFMMNGQTGKVIGKPPVSKGKIFLRFLLTFGITFAICLALGVFLL